MCEVLQQKRNIKSLISALVLFASLLFSAFATAEPRFKTGHRYYNFDQTHRPDATLVPTRMMNDEQLFLAADTKRNDKVPLSHLQANHFWLRSQQGDCYKDSAALRKILQMTLSNMYPSLSYSGDKYSDEEAGEESYRESTYSFKNLDNYSLRLSQKRVFVKFKYKF